MVALSQGEIIEVSLDPSLGHEPCKKRPALVVSGRSFNINSSLTYIAPITSVDNGYPLHLSISDNDACVVGFACLEQMRAVDLVARSYKSLGAVSEETLNLILNYFPAIFDL